MLGIPLDRQATDEWEDYQRITKVDRSQTWFNLPSGLVPLLEAVRPQIGFLFHF